MDDGRWSMVQLKLVNHFIYHLFHHSSRTSNIDAENPDEYAFCVLRMDVKQNDNQKLDHQQHPTKQTRVQSPEP